MQHLCAWPPSILQGLFHAVNTGGKLGKGVNRKLTFSLKTGNFDGHTAGCPSSFSCMNAQIQQWTFW